MQMAPVPEIASFDSMTPMIPLMLDGTYNPGQLVAVREIKSPAMAASTPPSSQATCGDYTVIINDSGTPADFSDDIVTVVDNSATGRDGIDRLTHIERLQFADHVVAVGLG